MSQLNETIYNVLDTTGSKNTGQWLTYNAVTEYSDGSAMDDDKCDGVIYRKKSDGSFWRRNFDGLPSASWFGIVGDGTDQTANINTALSFDHVKGIKFNSQDRKAITITGTVTVPAGKKVIFENSNLITGEGTWSGGWIVCDVYEKCFDTDVTIENLVNSTVSVCWFGAVADSSIYDGVATGTDSQYAFAKAHDALKNLNEWAYHGVSARIHIPAPQGEFMYKLLNPWIIRRTCEIFGDGMVTTMLFFPSSAGIKLVQDGYHNSSRYVVLRDMWLGAAQVNQDALLAFDATKHGVTITSNYNKITNVAVHCFPGNGFNVEGNAPTTNANNNVLTGCRGIGCSGSGIRFYGADSNNNTMINCDFSGNSFWGCDDNSFLGNTGIGVHSASNGSNAFNKSRVNVGGNGYYAIQNSTGIQPGVTSGWADYWHSLGAGYPTSPQYPDWDSGTAYEIGGGYYIPGPTTKGGYVGCYSEEDEYTGENLGDTILIGGFAASTALKGNLITSRNNRTFFRRTRTGKELVGYIEQESDTTGNILYHNYIAGGDNVGFLYDGNNHLLTAHTGGNSMGWFIMPDTYNPARIGRSSFPIGIQTAIDRYQFVRAYDNAYFNFRAFITGLAAPTAGKWAEGDVIINANEADVSLIGWKCITAGDFATTPPVFVPIGQNSGTTANRPVFTSGTNKGYQYFDETLGYRIDWNGSNWVNHAGTTV